MILKITFVEILIFKITKLGDFAPHCVGGVCKFDFTNQIGQSLLRVPLVPKMWDLTEKNVGVWEDSGWGRLAL